MFFFCNTRTIIIYVIWPRKFDLLNTFRKTHSNFNLIMCVVTYDAHCADKTNYVFSSKFESFNYTTKKHLIW